MELTERERAEIIASITAGRPLPRRYLDLLVDPAAGPELVWPGKPVEIAREVVPFETVERFGTAPAGEWTNKLVWGDNRLVLSSLADGPLREQIDAVGGLQLVYVDPPFDVGSDFPVDLEIGGDAGSPPAVVQDLAYRDSWGRGADSYLSMIHTRLVLLHDLLAASGSLYVHVDPRVASHVKLLLDEIFGPECFQREIVWRIGWVSGYKSAAANWIRNHDVLLYYVKDPEHFTFNKEYLPYPPGYVRRDGKPPTGRGYPIEDVWNASPAEHALRGADSLDSIQIKSFSTEKTGYATQKNESILRRIVRASSNPGDLVADLFCGSGTTLAVAEQLGRRWIGADLGRLAVHTTTKRLLELRRAGRAPAPFDVLRLRPNADRADDPAPSVQIATCVDGHGVEVSLVGFTTSGPDDEPRTADLAPGRSVLTVDDGRLVRHSTDRTGSVTTEVLTRCWSDWIDYWSVDFGDGAAPAAGFTSHWQSYRTKQHRALPLTSSRHVYARPGRYDVTVRVIDVFGRAATAHIGVEVAP